MELQQYTVALLLLREDGPVLDDEAAASLQDEHMAHLAHLYDTGALVAAGPLLDERLRGLTIFRVDADQVLELEADDPAVRAGRLSVQVVPWLVPEGVIAFPQGRLPAAMSDLG
jgi:uncharacterized protein